MIAHPPALTLKAAEQAIGRYEYHRFRTDWQAMFLGRTGSQDLTFDLREWATAQPENQEPRAHFLLYVYRRHGQIIVSPRPRGDHG